MFFDEGGNNIMYLVPNPIEIKVLNDFNLYIKFKNGEEKILNMKNDLEKKYYKKLKDFEYFKTVKISETGITIKWKDGEDISPKNL